MSSESLSLGSGLRGWVTLATVIMFVEAVVVVVVGGRFIMAGSLTGDEMDVFWKSVVNVFVFSSS